jgi:two-component system alkaline phosphatase synthesis response regulator PhoP
MRKKILLVDDNKHLLGLLRLNLKGQGFSIATAANGIDAIQKAISVAPDLILLDLLLPGLDGFAVCETLRKHPTTCSTPIIIMTGLSGQFTRYAGFESGGTDFIAKPVTPKALLSKIRRLLNPTDEDAKSTEGVEGKVVDGRHLLGSAAETAAQAST